MRFSVQHGLQNALFRRVRFSSPAQTPTRLTQKRILAVGPHGKPHSGCGPSRKSALWPRRLTQKRTLSPAPHGKAYSGPDGSQKTAFCVRAVTKGRALYPRDGYQKPMQSWLSAARPGKTWRGERPSSCGGATDPPSPPPTSTPSVPLPVPRKHQVLRLGLGCIKRTFRFGKWRVAFTPISLPCPTQQRGKTGNGSVEPRRKVKERCS